jgi:YD repeat-containing protein
MQRFFTYLLVLRYIGRLVKETKQGEDEATTVTFKYDPFGRRIEKKVEEIEDGKAEETKTYNYVYDNEAIILEREEQGQSGKNRVKPKEYILQKWYKCLDIET